MAFIESMWERLLIHDPPVIVIGHPHNWDGTAPFLIELPASLGAFQGRFEAGGLQEVHHHSRAVLRLGVRPISPDFLGSSV